MFKLTRRFSSLAEWAVEWAIRLCGWSAILFVFAIFAYSGDREHRDRSIVNASIGRS
jgi:hypothetical protein